MQQATPSFPSLHGLAFITAVTARRRGDLLIRHVTDVTRDNVMEMWSEMQGGPVAGPPLLVPCEAHRRSNHRLLPPRSNNDARCDPNAP